MKSTWGLTPIIVITVGMLNIALNVHVKKAALLSLPPTSVAKSGQFWLAFLVGCLSFVGLFFLYSSRIELARAIPLIGVVSIVGGSCYGAYLERSLPPPSESAMIAILFLLFIYRLLTWE
jgi:hypothetical protein